MQGLIDGNVTGLVGMGECGVARIVANNL